MRFFLALAFVLLASPAAAYNPSCGERAELIGTLAAKYGEVPVGIGATITRQALEIFASEGGETWSAVVHNPSGQSCIVAHGEGWRALPVEPPGAV